MRLALLNPRFHMWSRRHYANGSGGLPTMTAGRPQLHCSNRKHLVGVRDTWRPHPGGIGFCGLRMVRHQPFHFAQRRRRIPNLAISRGGHFALVVALRHRRLVNPDSDWVLQFRICPPFPVQTPFSPLKPAAFAVIVAREFETFRARAFAGRKHS